MKIIGLVLVIFGYSLYFRPSEAQQDPVTSFVQLQVCGTAGACGYGTSLNLGSQTTSYSSLVFSGSFSSPFRCEDLNGQTSDRVMTMQASNLVNQTNSNFIIPANNVELKNSAAHIIGGDCPIDEGTTSWTPIGNMPAVILGKTYSMNQVCKVQADTVSLRITTLPSQEIGKYSGELTITYSNFDDTIDCRSTMDPNCEQPDTILNYGGAPIKWAGCNSTLGNGAGVTSYGENNDFSAVYDCSGTMLGALSQFYSSTGKEINISSGCKIDNIFGKLYRRYPEGSGMGTDLACPYGRHLSSDAERKILEYLYGIKMGITSNLGGELYIDNFYNDQYGSDGRRGIDQGRSGTQYGLLTFSMGLPLAGLSVGGSIYQQLGSAGNYRTQTLSGSTTAWMRKISYNESSLFRNKSPIGGYYSARCVRNCERNFICAPGERCEVDPSCCNHDIQFTTGGTTYRRAGCNSTIGDMENDSSIFDYSGYAVSCNLVSNQISYNGFNLKEIGLGGSCKIRNNFGKLYQRDDSNGNGLRYNCKQSASNNFNGTTNNSNCPCPDGRHVPTTGERNKAIAYYSSLGGINGRDGNQQGLTWQFQLPLAGWCSSTLEGGCGFRGQGGTYQSSNGGFGAMTTYDSDLFEIISKSISHYVPVRCIKD